MSRCPTQRTSNHCNLHWLKRVGDRQSATDGSRAYGHSTEARAPDKVQAEGPHAQAVICHLRSNGLRDFIPVYRKRPL